MRINGASCSHTYRSFARLLFDLIDSDAKASKQSKESSSSALNLLIPAVELCFPHHPSRFVGSISQIWIDKNFNESN